MHRQPERGFAWCVRGWGGVGVPVPRREETLADGDGANLYRLPSAFDSILARRTMASVAGRAPRPRVKRRVAIGVRQEELDG
jgi:hypothetical protein